MRDAASAVLRKWWTVPASIALVWHVVALVLAPAPPSHVAGEIYPFFKPYLRALNLDHQWSFFAPEPSPGMHLRYRVLAEGEQVRSVEVQRNLERWSQHYFRYTTIFGQLREESPYVQGAVAHLCRLHAEERPRAIVLEQVHQLRLTLDEYRAGARPLDEANLEVRPLEQRPCP